VSAPSSRARLFGLAAAVLGLAVSAGLAEVALRVADYPPSNFSPWIRSDRYGFRLAPGIATRMRGPEYDVEVRTNSLGLRDDEPGPKAGPRVLLLGDSFAMGYGVPRGELFADLLEKQLGIDVVDAGTGGYEIVQQPRMLADLAPRLQPDLVVYALYLGNDLAQNDEWEVAPDGALRNHHGRRDLVDDAASRLRRHPRVAHDPVRGARREPFVVHLDRERDRVAHARDLGEDALGGAARRAGHREREAHHDDAHVVLGRDPRDGRVVGRLRAAATQHLERRRDRPGRVREGEADALGAEVHPEGAPRPVSQGPRPPRARGTRRALSASSLSVAKSRP